MDTNKGYDAYYTKIDIVLFNDNFITWQGF